MLLTRSQSRFSRIAKWTSHMTGRPTTFVMAVAVILLWAATGPFFHFSDTWQLVINTGTTIITFLMVFLIQSEAHQRCECGIPSHLGDADEPLPTQQLTHIGPRGWFVSFTRAQEFDDPLAKTRERHARCSTTQRGY